MKQLNLLLAIVLLFIALPFQAQISQGGTPLGKSQALSLENVPVTSLPSFNLSQVMIEDEQDEKDGNYPKIGRVLTLGMSPSSHGEWTELEDGGRLWRGAIKSRDAQGLSVQFENFELPEGSELFIYSPDYKHTIGGFTSFNNHESGILSTEIIPSDEVIVEYYEPAQAGSTEPFTISGVVHCYRMVPGAESSQRDFGDSDACQVNINCSEGNSWQDQKRGVARVFVIEGQFGGWCTGSLVNNTAEDCTPYLLTALHCGLNATVANMNQWVFYFNYESSGCSNGTSGQVPSNTMSGCARIADSGDGGGNNGSDYLLVEINNEVPGAYNPYFNGWRSTTTNSSSGASIHHPSGDIKKISTYSSNLGTATWGGPAGTHWVVQWSSTTNGHGVTEGGSSGSPIFDNNGLLIGTLTGGSSFCNTPNNPDLYGRMSYHWGSNPGDDLSDFLDPTNSGATALGGTNEPCDGGGGDDCVTLIPYPEDDPCVISVIAADDFCCNDTWDDVCEGAYIACSQGGECEAGTVSVSTSQDICPGETGIFDATGVSIPPGGGYTVQFLPDGGTGGNEVGFSITAVEPLPFEFDADINGILSANEFPPLEGTWVATGFAYTDPEDAGGSFCSLTEVEVVLNFLLADDPACQGGGGDNDDCADAEIVAPGVHAFSTVEATTDGPDQPGSPCDAFEESNVANDIWYEYTATCDGLASLSTCGTVDFDTRLAVYPGGQCPPTAASLIICNDDFGDCAGFSSYAEWDVTQGTTYLLRIGGYSIEDSGAGTFELTEECGQTGGDCVTEIPYPEDDPCVVSVIDADPFCCNDTWDSFCQDAYDLCDNGGGSDCEAGSVTVSLNQNVCPGETGIFNADGVIIPDGGGYAVQFVPDGGTGGPGAGFSITQVQPLPFEFDAGINGILDGAGFPPLEGTWVLTGFTYTNPDSAAATFCSIADVDVIVNFLLEGDPECVGGDSNDDCADATVVTPGVHAFSTVDATTDGPDQPGTPCDAFEESNVANDIWYEYTASCDGLASMSTCGTADFDTRIAVYPGGQCPPTAGSLIICNDDFGDCEGFSSYLEWEVSQGTTYLLRVGGFSDIDFGTGTFELIEDCDFEPTDWCEDWVDPTPASGYNNFNTEFGGAPTPDENGDCTFNEITAFEVWMSEAYAMDNIQVGVTYTFSHCNGPGAGTWVPEYTIITPGGEVDAYGLGDGDGCSITWIASESGTYLIVINEAGNCGVAAQVDNGFPAITCSDEITGVAEQAGSAFTVFPNPNSGQFNIQYVGEAGVAQVEVLEVSGKKVKSTQFTFNSDTFLPVDLGEQAKGMYFVRITMNAHVIVQKVMVH